jgi:hypothetical protein
MASNDYDIVNYAMIRLGAKTITSMSDGSRNQVAASVIYDTVREDLQRGYEWNFNQRTAALARIEANVLTITNVTQADPGVVTYTGTDPEDGDLYKVTTVVGMTELNNNTYVISSVNTVAKTFALMAQTGLPVDTSAYTAYGSAGIGTQQLFDNDSFEYLFTVPTNCLRGLWINNNKEEQFEILKEGLVSNSDQVELTYNVSITDVTKFDANFVDTFAWKLAAELGHKLTGSTKKADWALNNYFRSLSTSSTADAREGKRPFDQYTRYQNSRR